jgi:hypothetical protein
MLYIEPMSTATNQERATMTTDPREIPQTREEKLAATSTMYSTANIKATDGVTSYFTKEIDKDQAAERLALPALWETFSYDRTAENFDAYRDAYLAVNGSFPYDHLRPEVKVDPAYVVVAARANSGAKVHAMYAGNRILFCRSNVGGTGWRLHNQDLEAVDCRNCKIHLDNQGT